MRKNDSINLEDITIENLTLSNGLKLLISESTHLLSTSVSCTDFIFTNHSNMDMKSSVFPSIYPQIVFAKINSNIFYSLPYTWLIWNYGKANRKATNNAITNFDWEKICPHPS